MAVELDPLFLKAITLLNSKHPDSGRQLKVLVQEYREKITGEPKREKIERRDSVAERVSPKIVEKSQHASDRSMSPVFSLSVTSSSVTQVDSASTTTAVEVVEEMSSSSYGDVLKEEQLDASMVKSIEELANSSFDSAIMEELNSSGLLEPSAKKKKLDTVIKEDSISSLSEEEEDSDDLLDETLEDFDGPKCCVCQSPSTDSPDNSLVECHECHNQYHQKCHKPPVTSKDVHDPRFVLYCSQCSRRMKKEMAAQKSSLSTSSTSMQEPTVAKPVTNPFQVKTSIQPFRRPTSSGNASEQTKAASSPFMPTALLQGNNGSNNGQSQNSQRGGPSLPQDVRMKSMKRLEQVKKRAKMQQQMRKR